MTIEIKAPAFPESITEGTVATWHKQPGEAVNRDELIVDIETDKVVMEVVAPADGHIAKVLKAEGDIVEGNEVIAEFLQGDGVADVEAPAAEPEAVAQAPAPASDGEKVDIKTPAFPESIAEGTIATWHKQLGETVSRDEIIVDIETDKVVMEVAAPADGQLSKVLKAEGETVESNEVIAEFSKGAALAQPAASEANDNIDESVAGPAARKMMNENNLQASAITATGKDGRITKEDVAAHLQQNKTAAPAAATETVVAPLQGERPEKRVPMTRLRATIASRLVQAQQTAAMLTTYNEVNMQPIMDLRARYKEDFQKAHDGTKLGFMSFFVKASVEALKRYPAVNASIDGKDMVYHGYQDVGVAVSTEKGLVVPVLRNAETMGLADIESTIAAYGAKARDGKLGIEEMTGGTFTISNGGVFGSLMSTPILNPPQTAILGMHKIQERPMAVNGEVKILPMMYLAVSYDHRMIDGREAVQFLICIKELLEDPARILLQV